MFEHTSVKLVLITSYSFSHVFPLKFSSKRLGFRVGATVGRRAGGGTGGGGEVFRRDDIFSENRGVHLENI